MACPFFEPREVFDEITARLPLGQAFEGACLASDRGQKMPVAICNHGYARGRCDRFPASHEVDANRFARTGGGGVIWIEEAAHAPLRFASAAEIPLENRAARYQLKAFEQSESEGKIR